MLLSLALILSYIESLLPDFTGIPGVKLGLANSMTLITMEIYGRREAFIVLILRILLTGLLFGNMFGILFSLSGGLLAFLAMAVSYGIRGNDSSFGSARHETEPVPKSMPDFAERHGAGFSIIGVSILGAVFHNIGQLCAAAFIVKELKIVYYGPVLLVSGLFTGFLVGFLAKLILPRLKIISGKGEML